MYRYKYLLIEEIKNTNNPNFIYFQDNKYSNNCCLNKANHYFIHTYKILLILHIFLIINNT